VRRRDEFGAVAEAFNRMVGQLEVAHGQILEKGEHMLDLEQQLRRAATLAVAGKLASGIAHEVGTPLNIISGRAEILLRSLPADDPGRAELQVIIGQIDRISGIIRSLLDTVRPQKPEVQAVVLGSVVERLVPLLGHMGRRGGISIVADVPPDLPQIAADPGQLQQILINLLINALEASPPGGRITVTARVCRHDGRPGVATTVTDAGSGIPREVVGKVFEPFFTTKPTGQGTGLGLAICRDITQSHEGALSVESREGEGTTFTLWLPRHEAPV
jgi:signal transduction histidine kinase